MSRLNSASAISYVTLRARPTQRHPHQLKFFILADVAAVAVYSLLTSPRRITPTALKHPISRIVRLHRHRHQSLTSLYLFHIRTQEGDPSLHTDTPGLSHSFSSSSPHSC